MSKFLVCSDSAMFSSAQESSIQTDHLAPSATHEYDTHSIYASSGISPVALDDQGIEALSTIPNKGQRQPRANIISHYRAKRREIRRNTERDLAFFRLREKNWQKCEGYTEAWLRAASWLSSQTHPVMLRPAGIYPPGASGGLPQNILVQTMDATGSGSSQARLLSEVAEEWDIDEKDLLACCVSQTCRDVGLSTVSNPGEADLQPRMDERMARRGRAIKTDLTGPLTEEQQLVKQRREANRERTHRRIARDKAMEDSWPSLDQGLST